MAFLITGILCLASALSGETASGEPVETLRIEKGNLAALFRDNSSSPKVLSGVDSLFNTKDAPLFDAFDPDGEGSSAGLNFEHVISGHASPSNSFTPRRGSYTLHRLPDGASALLVRKVEDDPWALSSTLKYTVTEPNAIDFELRCQAEDPARFGQRGYAILFFANYMNDVAEVPIHFRGIRGPGAREEWISADAPPGHRDYNGGGTFRSAEASDLEYDPDHNFKLNLWSYDYPRFTQPFYYGIARNNMLFLLMFDKIYSPQDEIRFSLFKFKIPRHPRPAWDFQYVIHKLERGKDYGFKGRLVWKKFVSPEDCLQEVERWKTSLKSAETRLSGLSSPVDVHFDDHGMPHIFAAAWTDASRALGYLHARDRLWQMDFFRRRASGTMAEIFGKASLASDILARQLGLRRSSEQLWAVADFPGELREEILAYSAGVNARIDELGKDGLPPPFKRLGYEPAPWTPVDSLVFSKYMAWDQSGTDTDLSFGKMVEKLGPSAVEELWPLDRPYEEPAVRTQAARPKTASAPLRLVPGGGLAVAAAERFLSQTRWFLRGESFGSNNWAVDGTKTASAKPILASDPHLGFHLPSIWYACHLSIAGRSVAGVTFPVSPIIIIGHNDRLGWGLTNLQADAVDYFVETLKPDDPLQYKHRGEWKKVERRVEEIPVRGEPAHVLHIDSTVHGPIISRDGRTSDGRAIALEWTGLVPTREVISFWRIGRAKDLQEFLSALEDFSVPALNILYADIDGNIALHCSGALPLRMPGQGRIPMDGASGDNDWTEMIPRSELPLAINPPEHFVASANGRPASIGYPHYLGWMWDPSYRIRRIHEMLGAANGLTVETMGRIQTDAHDKAAERFLPPLLEALERSKVEDESLKSAALALRDWDYVASGDAVGPVLWLEWFRRYRDLVWDDEWKSRGIEKEGGSWGFTSDNRREPMLEVLEYMTREHPRSAWFDDRATEARETRDEIAARAFTEAIAALKKRFGDDRSQWNWKNINKLRIPSLTRDEALGRSGIPVPGTPFTVSPGGDTGPVDSGASWRLIVDFGDVTRSVGVYPGGQSEDPGSPSYDDQIRPWAEGKYLPLHAVSEAARLPESVRERRMRFLPDRTRRD